MSDRQVTVFDLYSTSARLASLSEMLENPADYVAIDAFDVSRHSDPPPSQLFALVTSNNSHADQLNELLIETEAQSRERDRELVEAQQRIALQKRLIEELIERLEPEQRREAMESVAAMENMLSEMALSSLSHHDQEEEENEEGEEDEAAEEEEDEDEDEEDRVEEEEIDREPSIVITSSATKLESVEKTQAKTETEGKKHVHRVSVACGD